MKNSCIDSDLSLKDRYQGQLLLQESLADYTSWRVGGVAKFLYKPAGIADLSIFLQQLAIKEPVLWLGLGSNTLIRDKGFAGTVILTQGALNAINLLTNNLIRVEAGVSCAKMARFSARYNLAGGEFLAGIPGTMGGALRMNAGCAGSETWRWVVEVETMTRRGVIRSRPAHEFKAGYRDLSGLCVDEWFIAATFKFPTGNKNSSLQLIKELLAHRAATQPTGEHNGGSVFRNPPNNYAAALIESCNLKGLAIGGAVVSEKHANFIVNNGTAVSADIESLIGLVHKVVYEQTAVNLVREVHIVGDN